MQDYTNEQTKTIIIKANKLTAKVLAQAMKAVLSEIRRRRNPSQRQSAYKGKQSVKKLIRQGAGASNIEITDANIKAFEPIARKYGIDYALRKDTTETPPKWLVFFKSKDADALTAAFKEFTAKQLNKGQNKKPSLLGALKVAKTLAAKLVTDRVKNKDKSMEL